MEALAASTRLIILQKREYYKMLYIKKDAIIEGFQITETMIKDFLTQSISLPNGIKLERVIYDETNERIINVYLKLNEPHVGNTRTPSYHMFVVIGDYIFKNTKGEWNVLPEHSFTRTYDLENPLLDKIKKGTISNAFVDSLIQIFKQIKHNEDINGIPIEETVF